MLTIILAIVIFCLLVTVHEFGHFITAKMFGVTVHEFAVGMGPAIYKKQGKETLYSIRIIPVGGYCKMEGEDCESEDDGAFGNKSRWKKIIILAAGAIMNIILGYIIFTIIMFQVSQVRTTEIESLIDGFPAMEAGLKPGDEITKINGTRVYINSELTTEIARNGESPAELTVVSDGETKTVVLTPKKNDNGQLLIGFAGVIKKLSFTDRFFYAYRNSVDFAKLILVSFGDLITGKVGINNLSGPAGIVNEIGNAAQMSQQKQSAVPLLSFVAFITINLGVFNLLPIPALDGGRIFFVIVSAIIRRDIPAEKEGLVHFIGLLLLFGLIIYATGNDLLRIFRG